MFQAAEWKAMLQAIQAPTFRAGFGHRACIFMAGSESFAVCFIFA
jgi:hypothetical protein